MVENESRQAPPVPGGTVGNNDHSHEQLSKDEEMIASIFRDILSSAQHQPGETPMETDQREAENGQFCMASSSSIQC